MPEFISKLGEWHPAKEKIGLTNQGEKTIKYDGKNVKPGDPFVYDGPDREAVKVLNQEGHKNRAGELVLGQDFRNDPDFLDAIAKRNFPRGEEGVKQYLEFIGFSEEEASKNFNKRMGTVQAHEVPKKVKAINELGGGRDYSGQGNNVYGGFGDSPNT